MNWYKILCIGNSGKQVVYIEAYFPEQAVDSV